MSFNLLDQGQSLGEVVAQESTIPLGTAHVIDTLATAGTFEDAASTAAAENTATAVTPDSREAPGPEASASTSAPGSVLEGEEESKSSSDSDDDWDEISKGRYFGAGDDKDEGPLCHNCKQTGHKKKDCPHQLCRSCGALDDHDTMRCPMTQRCYNCSRLGHMASKCPEPYRQVGSFCHDCGSKSHLERSCPQIWRLYQPSPKFDIDGSWHIEAWCYNCAAKGHYGDDCDKPHRMRLIEQSAFCQANQPESRHERAQRETYDHQQVGKHQRLDDEGRADDWFARQASLHGPGSNRLGTNYNSFQHGNSSYGYPPPPLPPPSRGSRQQGRYDPYKRPSGPIITSERYPRGLPFTKGNSPHGHSPAPRDYGRGKEKRKPVPAAQRLSAQIHNHGRPQQSRGGKAYRGGGRR
ncbi:Protein air1 [Taphrina deformans PYCC 5710]|uniref:Protein air1 n=1 Tax=Taphrina deformans (strain PYCC 5710 / ATCC 11124 / CBS 356.35 / IMI 108563 / JCM 9778 / NBRC 8474) TaxID=1097556 RepID=R4X8P5_TAPDE|nr:Protein air1 [Taphrina deformans PYCC 5710]|eukprot:CCG82008.1 Protein air1 [Taphrina deformans PYCC 5710]